MKSDVCSFLAGVNRKLGLKGSDLWLVGWAWTA